MAKKPKRTIVNPDLVPREPTTRESARYMLPNGRGASMAYQRKKPEPAQGQLL